MILNLFQIAEIEARRNAARRHVDELCKTGKWRMSVPVRMDADSDIIISDALRDSEALQACVRDLTAQLADATKRADDAERERDAALAVLRDVQWSSNAGYNGSCPCCYNEEAASHRANCALAACLKGAE